MITPIDAFTLSSAKIHSKRVMLIITVLVSGLLFGVLYGAIIVFGGISKSANEYTKSAQNGEFLVKSSPNIPGSVFGPDVFNTPENVIDELSFMQAEYISNQKDLAKKLGITFDVSSLENILVPSPFASQNLPASQRVMVNRSSPVYQEYLQKLQMNYANTAQNKLSDLKQIASKYNATSYHAYESVAAGFTNLTYLKDGNENLSNIGQYRQPVNSDMSAYGYVVSSVQNSMYLYMDDSLINRFILPANDKRQSNTDAIPVIISSKEAVDEFGSQIGVSAEPSDSNAADQIVWMKNLQDKINGVIYHVCYRNDTDISRLAQIAQINQDILTNKNNTNYTMPSLIYDLPSVPCGDIILKSDTRTTAEKEAANRQIEIDKQLGVYVAPSHYLFTFQIVGVMPASSQQDSITSLSSFMSSLLGAQYGSGAIIPTQMYNSLPDDVRQENILLNSQLSSFNNSEFEKANIVDAIVGFDSLDNARSFIKNEGCSDTDNQCSKPFYLESFGSNYLLVDDLDKTTSMVLQIAFPIVIIIAAIIMGITMARVIIDSRRETAIFRAIGAKRIDIITVYLIYSTSIATRTIIFSLLLGVSIAGVTQVLYSAQVTNYAKVAYGVFDDFQMFTFIDFPPTLLILLTICIILVNLLAISPSLIRNVRRNPIKDMRDE